MSYYADHREHHDDQRVWAALAICVVLIVVTLVRCWPMEPQPAESLTVVGGSLQFRPPAEQERASCRMIDYGRLAPFFFAPVPVNSADKDLLMTLPGIGEGLALRIIAYREQHGPMTSIDAFSAVRGIGDKRIAALKDLISFDE